MGELTFTWNDLKFVSEILFAIGSFLFFFYRRLKKKLKKLDTKFEGKIDALDKKFEGKIDHLEEKFDVRFDRMDQKFDRLIEILIIKNVQPPRTHFHKPKGKTA